MSARIPCPVCGTDNEPGATSCTVCDYAFGSGVVPESRRKCPRCGSEVVDGYDFCQVCGLDLRSRLPRPGTRNLNVRGLRNQLRDQVIPRGPHGFSGGQGGASPAALARAPGPSGVAPRVPAPAPVTGPRATPGASGLRTAVVLVRRDGSDGEAYEIGPGGAEIGRDRGAIRFSDDPFVSPLHARLLPQGDGSVEVVDLGSLNGVFVRLASVEPVYPGDQFLLGHHLLRLDNAPSIAPDPARPDGVRAFGTPLDPPWGRLSLLAVGGRASDHYELRGATVVFGRESGDIIFPRDPYLSRQHAQIRMELRSANMAVMLEDLDSANGTYLRMRGQATLRPGDGFRVGDQIFRVRGA